MRVVECNLSILWGLKFDKRRECVLETGKSQAGSIAVSEVGGDVLSLSPVACCVTLCQ
jgi:hypothetical protein